MSINNHTPGPWKTDRTVCRDIVVCAEHEPDGEVCCISRQDPQNSGDRSFAAEEANARLIAAAPELLQALRPLLFELEQILISTKHFPECAVKQSRRCAVELARAAIARATGGVA